MSSATIKATYRIEADYGQGMVYVDTTDVESAVSNIVRDAYNDGANRVRVIEMKITYYPRPA
jgi:hypothetical protein